MSAASTPWPCPACAELVPLGYHDCPACGISADWIDLLRAVDFAIRRFELWKTEGWLSRDEYQALTVANRRRREGLIHSAHTGQPLPPDTGLPPRLVCWNCQKQVGRLATQCASCAVPLLSPEARLLRYQTFLCGEIKRHQQEGRLTAAQWEQFLTDTPARQVELLERLRAQ